MTPQPQQLSLLADFRPLPEPPMQRVPAKPAPAVEAQKASTQAERLYALLQDRRPHRTDEIVRVVYKPGQSLARVAARIHDVKRKYGAEIHSWRDPDHPALYYYHLIKTETAG